VSPKKKSYPALLSCLLALAVQNSQHLKGKRLKRRDANNYDLATRLSASTTVTNWHQTASWRQIFLSSCILRLSWCSRTCRRSSKAAYMSDWLDRASDVSADTNAKYTTLHSSRKVKINTLAHLKEQTNSGLSWSRAGDASISYAISRPAM